MEFLKIVLECNVVIKEKEITEFKNFLKNNLKNWEINNSKITYLYFNIEFHENSWRIFKEF